MRRREKENEKGENPSKSSDARLCVGGLAPVWHCGVVWVTQQNKNGSFYNFAKGLEEVSDRRPACCTWTKVEQQHILPLSHIQKNPAITPQVLITLAKVLSMRLWACATSKKISMSPNINSWQLFVQAVQRIMRCLRGEPQYCKFTHTLGGTIPLASRPTQDTFELNSLPLLCTTFPSDMLNTERIQHTTSGTKRGPRKEHISAMASPVQLFMSLPHLD
ncbi:hypothetical protein F2P79_021458 [Pimephales promelas]|nr:hypothetical protein F2P79_021458 [Pimephales promelas]